MWYGYQENVFAEYKLMEFLNLSDKIVGLEL